MASIGPTFTGTSIDARLPNFLLTCRDYFINNAAQFMQEIQANRDPKATARDQSNADERIILEKISEFTDLYNFDLGRTAQVWVPASASHWFDFSFTDPDPGGNDVWHPVNIKSDKFVGASNAGNLSILVQAYSSVDLMEDMTKLRDNPSMFAIIQEMYSEFELEDFASDPPVPFNAFLQEKANTTNTRYNSLKFNRFLQKDYFFFVYNKESVTNGLPLIVVNSILGIPKKTPNLVNFEQIKWRDNLDYQFGKDLQPLMRRRRVSDITQLVVLKHWATEYLVRIHFAQFLKRYSRVNSFMIPWIGLIADARRRINA